MSKVIKLKQSDIERIVENILSEQGFDDFDTQIQPEELPQEPEISPEDMEDEPQAPEFLLGKDEEGNIALINTKTGEEVKR